MTDNYCMLPDPPPRVDLGELLADYTDLDGDPIDHHQWELPPIFDSDLHALRAAMWRHR